MISTANTEYILVHVYWTIPAFFVLLGVYFPLRKSIDVFRVAFLSVIAVAWTIPWDSYLIRNRIWTYPPNVVLGLTLFSIPVEELFFFIIQTSITSVLYLILSKPVLHPVLLPTREHPPLVRHTLLHRLGLSVLAAGVLGGAWLVRRGGEGTYIGLILVWSCPVLVLIWSVAGYHILALPTISSLGPIILSTAYLWILDSFALRKGTWVIEHGTKLDIQLWSNFDLEEALFFLITNILVVSGQIAFDRGYSILTITTFNSPYASPNPFLSAPISVVASCGFTSRYMDNRQVMHRLDALRHTNVISKQKTFDS